MYYISKIVRMEMLKLNILITPPTFIIVLYIKSIKNRAMIYKSNSLHLKLQKCSIIHLLYVKVKTLHIDY